MEPDQADIQSAKAMKWIRELLLSFGVAESEIQMIPQPLGFSLHVQQQGQNLKAWQFDPLKISGIVSENPEMQRKVRDALRALILGH